MSTNLWILLNRSVSVLTRHWSHVLKERKSYNHPELGRLSIHRAKPEIRGLGDRSLFTTPALSRLNILRWWKILTAIFCWSWFSVQMMIIFFRKCNLLLVKIFNIKNIHFGLWNFYSFISKLFLKYLVSLHK